MRSSSSSHIHRRGLVKAAIWFALLVFIGTGWAIHAGRVPYLSLKTSTADLPSSGANLMTSEDYATLDHEALGASVGVAKVVSGDTIALGGKQFRLWGVQTLDGARQDGRQFLARWLDGQWVACYERSASQWGEPLAQCVRGRIDAGTALVQAGLATTVPNETREYEVTQQSAQNLLRGYWAEQ